MATVPTRDEVLQMLDGLCTGRASRDAASAWAAAIVDDDSVNIPDRAILDVLKNIGAADLPATDRDYLYTEADFRDWAMQLRQSP